VQHEGDLYAGTWIGVWKSTDQAQSWAAAGLQGDGIFALGSWSSILYAGTFDGEVWASLDGGDNWDPVGSGLPNDCVQSLARLGPVLYAALANQGVYALPDGETEWAAMNAGLPELTMEPLAASGGTLFVGLAGQGVYRWNAGSEQWDATALESQQVFCLTDTPDGLMAGTRGGLYVTNDEGLSWTLEYDGLKEWLPVRAIAVGDDEYYAGLEGGGVYRAAFPGGAFETPPSAERGPWLAVRPNPAHAGAEVSFRLAQATEIELAVYDPAGRRVATLAAEKYPAGVHSLRWDGNGTGGTAVAAGVYLIRLNAGGQEWTTKEIRVQ
jgi:photosystem II stability/assembly factor-like uncharacterized protein